MTDLFQAIKTGYRLFDGAYDYQNEKEAGEGIRRAIQEGIVKREEIFVTTKLYETTLCSIDVIRLTVYLYDQVEQLPQQGSCATYDEEAK